MRQPVYIVRHGQSEWNVAGRTQGQTPHPVLTRRGRAQSEAAGRCLQRALAEQVSDVRLHTSDLARAAGTARIIGAILDCDPRTDDRLRERHFGLRQGCRHSVTTRILRVPGAGPFLGVERASAVIARLRTLLDELDPSVPHILVTHGEVIRLLTDPAQSEVAANGSVLILPRTPNAP